MTALYDSRNIRALVQALVILVASINSAHAAQMSLSSAFLGAASALRVGDYAKAGQFYGRIFESGGEHASILRDSLISYVGAGDMASAVETAAKLDALEPADWLTHLCLLVESARAGNYENAEHHLAEYLYLTDPERQIDGEVPFVTREGYIWTRANLRTLQLLHRITGGLLRGWTELGQGSMNQASETFDGLAETETEMVIGSFHKMLALAHVGDYGSAHEINEEISGTNAFRMNRGYIDAHVQTLLQAGHVDAARKLLMETLDSYPASGLTNLTALIERVEAGPPFEFDFIRSPADGITEVLYLVATQFPSRRSNHFEMAHARLAEYMRPDFSESTLRVGNIFLDFGQYEQAAKAFESIGEDDPLFLDAQIGISDVMLESGDAEGAIAALRKMAETYPDTRRVHATLGDAFRSEERYGEATHAYNAAADLIPNPGQNSWFLYYARGITYERTGRWEEAEADFRFSLSLSPGQPLVLNYLGYSLADMGVKLDEARAMVESAVERRPNDGFILDSLGWVFYRQGLYEEAVTTLERAAELDPAEPVINDHLGDAYWMVDRKREADAQWRRALTFGAEEKDANRIRRKLVVGLDMVLEEEQASALTGNGNQ